MAKVKFSALISEMRNKLNGSVFSKNRAGNYLRNKITPVNPQTTNQQNNRMLLGSIASSWRDLTRTQIEAWNEATVNFPKTDIFGDTKYPSGFNLFTELNKNRASFGLPVLLVPPMPGVFPVFDVASVVASVGTPELEITLTGVAPIAFYQVLIEATPAVSNGKSYVKNMYRRVATSMTTNPDVFDAYSALFGTPIEGERAYLRIRVLHVASGQLSVPLEYMFQWAA